MRRSGLWIYIATILFFCFGGFAQAQSVVLENDVVRQELLFDNGWHSIQLCGLVPDQQYGFRLTGAMPLLAPETWQIQDGQYLSYENGVLSFIANGTCATVELFFHQADPSDLFPRGFSAWCTDCPQAKQIANRGIGVDYLPLDLLIEDVLFTGAGCWDFRDYSYLGEGFAIGLFYSAPLFDYGLIMSTGSIGNALGENNSPSAGTDWGLGGDLDLTASIIGNPQTFDAAILELDFTAPYTGFLEFRISFASEEYPAGNCDAFGIFASGPGISGPFSNNSQNFALLTGTSYQVNACDVGPSSNDKFYVDNTDGKDMQYDGYTIPLLVRIPIQECGDYHLKFAIADTGDGLFDSAVMIKSQDFGYIRPASMELIVPSTNSNVVYEQCSDAFLRICRIDNYMLFDEVELNYTISPASTAQSGLDFQPFPATFIIPGPDECVDIPISVIADLLPEGDETLVISLDSPCTCSGVESVEVIIRDTPPLEITLDDVSVCQDDQLILEPQITSGVEQFSYAWSDGTSDPEINQIAEIPGTQQYSVTVTDECGQTATASANVSIIARPTATMEGDGYLCKGNPNKDTIPVTITLGPPSTAPWSLSYYINGVLQPVLTNITTPVITIPVTTTGYSEIQKVYNNSVCDGYIFGESFIEAVEVKTLLDTVAVSCFGAEDGQIIATGQEGFEPYTYQWSVPGEQKALLDSIGVGTYFVTVTDNLGCTAVDSMTLSSQTDIDITGVLIQGTSCQAATGSVDITVNGGELPYTYAWSHGSILEDPADLPEGLVFVTVTDNRGCESYASFDIPVPDAPELAATVTGMVTCASPTGGAATLNITGGAQPYQINWSGNGGSNQNPSGLNGGQYTVTVTDAAGCSSLDTILIPVDTLAPVAVTLPTDTMTCGITSLFLNGMGSSSGANISYAWTTANGSILTGSSTLQPEVGLPGTYNLVVTNTQNGCTDEAIVQVIPDQNAPQIQIEDPDTLTCNLTSTQLNALGSTSGPNIQVSWSTSNGMILSGGSSLQPTVGSPGTYTLILTNTANNCVASADVEVEGLQAALQGDIVSPGQLTCTNTQIILDASGSTTTPGTTLAWSTTDGSILGNTSGSTVQVDAAGTYTLILTDPASGCADTVSTQITADQSLPQAQAQVQGVLTCIQTSLPLDGTGSETGQDVVYQWSTADGNLNGPAQSLQSSCNAPGTYTLLVTDTGNGCTSQVSVTVAIDTLTPVANAGPTEQLDCLDPVLTLQGNGQAFSGNAVIQWTTNGGQILSGGNTLSPMINQMGTYTLVITDDANGCTAASTVVITADFAIPVVDIAPPALLTCASPSIVLDGSGSASGTQISPLWSTTGGNILTGGNTYQPTVNQVGTYQLLLVDGNSGCRDSMDVVVAENKIAPQADAGMPDQIACLGDSALLDGTGSSQGANITYDWYLDLSGLPVINNQVQAMTTLAGTYFLVVTDQLNGCQDTSTVTIPADFLNQATLNLVDRYCGDQVTELHIDSVQGGVLPYIYSIDGGATSQSDPVFRKLGPGLYSVVVTDGKGCTWSEDLIIPVEEGVIVTLPEDLTIELSDEVRIEGQTNIDPADIVRLTWYPPYGLDRTDSLVVFAQPGIAVLYTLTIEDARGCVGIDSITIVVHDPDVFIPTAFSPYNDDGVNDLFMIFAEVKGLVQVDQFQIFSRWGELLFQAEDFQPNDPKISWDGTQNGQPLLPGVYVYSAQIRLSDGRVKHLKGEVQLIR